VSVDDLFSKLVGRQATEAERERLYRVRDALGLRDNDAIWAIVMALEHYDSFFRRYPAQLAEATESAMEDLRSASRAAAAHEIALVQRVLAEKVAQTSVEIAKKLAGKPIGLHGVTLVLAAVVAFGGLCEHAGYSLGSPAPPGWSSRAADLRGTERLLACVLSVPAGWMVFALLLPAAAYGFKIGRDLATDVSGERRERILGVCIAALCVTGAAACIALLLKFT
jgi:hypothetical protein